MTNVCVDYQERVPDSPSPVPSLDDGRRSGSHLSSRQSSSVSSSPAHTESSSDRPRTSALSHKSLVFCFIPQCLITKSNFKIWVVIGVMLAVITCKLLHFNFCQSPLIWLKPNVLFQQSLVPEHLALCSLNNVKLHI